MSNRSTAIAFIECFCAGDVDRLERLLTDDLSFRGPFHELDAREQYLSVLRSDPPETCDFEIVSVTENEDSVAVFYEYQKADSPLLISQLFRFRQDLICETVLVFDPSGLDNVAGKSRSHLK